MATEFWELQRREGKRWINLVAFTSKAGADSAKRTQLEILGSRFEYRVKKVPLSSLSTRARTADEQFRQDKPFGFRTPGKRNRRRL